MYLPISYYRYYKTNTSHLTSKKSRKKLKEKLKKNMNIFDKIKAGKNILIAEAGVNHNGNLRLGEKLIKAAKEANADCIENFKHIKQIILLPKKQKILEMEW